MGQSPMQQMRSRHVVATHAVQMGGARMYKGVHRKCRKAWMR
jgi:hypothetical protein